jgi:hypothetical protein
VKRTCLLLVPAWLLMAGCITLPGGDKAPGKTAPPTVQIPPPPEPVNPDDVTSKNLTLKASDLEAEIRYDEVHR